MTNEELVALIQQGKDVQVNLGILYEQNKGFIYFVTRPYMKYAEKDDLIQEGYIGFQEAIFHYSAAYGAKFTTYAQYRIRKQCTKYIESFCNVKRIPSYLQTRITAYVNFVNEYKAAYSEEPDDVMIMQELQLTTTQLQHIRKTLHERPVISMSALIPGTDNTLEETIADPCDMAEDVQDVLFREFERQVLDEAIKQLDGNEQMVITCKYIDSLTSSQISERLNLSPDKVKRLEEKAMQVLRKNRKIQELLKDKYGYECSAAYKLSRKFVLDNHTSTTEFLALKRLELEKEKDEMQESVELLQFVQTVQKKHAIVV